MKENIESKEVNIIADYLGEEEDEIIPEKPALLTTILEFIYASYPDLEKEYGTNEHVDIYDIVEEMVTENPQKAFKLYQNILQAFSQNLITSKEDAYWLTEPFIEIFEEKVPDEFLQFLDHEEEFSILLLRDNYMVADSFISLLKRLIKKNDLISLKRYILLLNQNRYFEENGECIHFDEIIEELQEACDNTTSKEIAEYLSRF